MPPVPSPSVDLMDIVGATAAPRASRWFGRDDANNGLRESFPSPPRESPRAPFANNETVRTFSHSIAAAASRLYSWFQGRRGTRSSRSQLRTSAPGSVRYASTSDRRFRFVEMSTSSGSWLGRVMVKI